MINEVLYNLFDLQVILYLAGGVAGGICIGALPGLTATMGVALLLPFTFGLDTLPGILLVLGIYIGAIYGGSISAILLHTPGTPASAATAMDGHALALKGEARRTLGISTVSSFIGGIVSCIILILISPQLSKVALKFSSPEFFMLAVFGLSIIASVSGKSLIKGLISGCIGLLIATIGIDKVTGVIRFTYGNNYLVNGISYIPVMIGLFAFSEVLKALNKNKQDQSQIVVSEDKSKLTFSDLKMIFKISPYSGIIGTFIGIIPGAGADIGAFVSYNEVKRLSKNSDNFGKGAIEGVAAAEGGNNGVTGGALIPMLTLGIPGDAVAAIMIGALKIQGLQPGPLLFTENKILIYTIFGGLVFANIIMLVLGLAGVKLFAKVRLIPTQLLMPVIVVLCVVGSYAINSSLFDVGIMILCGIAGYLMYKIEMPVSPTVLGIILGPLAESHLRRALLLSDGSYITFFSSPISLFFLFMIIITLCWPVLKKLFAGSHHN